MTTGTAGADIEAQRHPRGRIARYALVLGGLTAFGPLSVDMYLPALPAMADDLHSSDAQVQLTLAVFLLGLGVDADELLAAVAALGDAEALALVVHESLGRRLEHLDGQHGGTGAEVENSLRHVCLLRVRPRRGGTVCGR